MVWGMWAESTKPSDVTSSLILLLPLLTLARLSFTTHDSYINIYKRQCFIYRTIFITWYAPWESEINYREYNCLCCLSVCLSVSICKNLNAWLWILKQSRSTLSVWHTYSIINWCPFKRTLHSSVSLWFINMDIKIILKPLVWCSITVRTIIFKDLGRSRCVVFELNDIIMDWLHDNFAHSILLSTKTVLHIWSNRHCLQKQLLY